MAAKYAVTQEPGTYIPGLGFIKPGEFYTAPAGHIPSRTCLPVNAEAAAELKKIKAALEAQAKEHHAAAANEKNENDERKVSRARARVLDEQARQVRVEPINVQREAPAVEAGLTIAELEGMRGSDQAPGEKQTRKL